MGVVHKTDNEQQVDEEQQAHVGEGHIQPGHPVEEHGESAAQRDTEILTGKHETVAATALVRPERADRQRVDGDVLGGAEHVIEHDHGQQQAEVLLEVHQGRDQQGGDHHDRAEDDPGPAPAQAMQLDHVDQRRPGPFESPRQHQGADEDADGLQ